MEKQEKYLAPEVEILEVEVERGFAATGDGEEGPSVGIDPDEMPC